MSSPLERLATSDPAAAGYAPRDLGAMVTRVVRSRAPRDPAWQRFRLRVAGAAASAALLTGAGVVALGAAGPALPILSFASGAAPTAGQASATHLPTMFMPLMRNWSFSAGASLSTQAGSATVYSLSPGTSGAAPLTAAATALGLAIGSPTSTDGTNYASTTPDYTAWLTDDSGYATWGILSTSPAATPNSDNVASTATDAFNAQAVADARALGGSVGAPSDSALGPDPSGPVVVTLPILVGGLATPFTYDFEFAADGTLLGADGASVVTTAVGVYPLLSPADAVAQVSDQLFLVPPGVSEGFTSPFAIVGGASSGAVTPENPPANGTGNSAPSATASSTVAPPPTDPSTTTTVDESTTTTTAPPIPVTLTSVSEHYGVYPMTNGTTLLLPVYVYSGTDPSGDSLTFSVIPVDPSYLDLSQIVRIMLY